MTVRNPPSSLIRFLAWQPGTSSLPTTFCTQHRTLRTKPVNAKTPILDKAGKLVVTRTIESMPFQAYQLALEIIRGDRIEKLQQIKQTQERLSRALAVPGVDPKARHILSLRKHLDRLRVLADANNPRVKYNFDNGIVGTNKPIYRHLLDKKWRSLARPTLIQRLTQLRLTPDILPTLNPLVDISLRFHGRSVKPGTILPTLRTESPPTVKITPFQPTHSPMLCTLAVVDPDVPDPARNGFKYRLHWLVQNVPISFTQTQAIGYPAPKNAADVVVPWLPPHVQKGIKYHRYGLFVFKQDRRIDGEKARGKLTDGKGGWKREGFVLRSWQAKMGLEAIGAAVWRNEWDEGTRVVMERHGLDGADMMWGRVKE
ncbi:phosphatidylethanolamine-binding protein [Terfezia claveryi]|nr:phosphatidylethanolamine-binding protein [Terfezia claveryi]